jgi:hypothetical protein
MRTPSFERAVFSLVALLAGAIVLRRATSDIFWSDFYTEAWPSYVALHEGDVSGFLAAAPAYVGFLALIGAPLTYVADAPGFDDVRLLPMRDLTEVYIATAIPGLVAMAWLGVTLAQRARARSGRVIDAMIVLVAGAPIADLALQFGHPEIVLAASAAVGAVLVARTGRIAAAGALLVLAVLCDEWSVIAILPAALAAPRANVTLGAGAGIACGVALLTAELVAAGPAGALFSSAGTVFHGHHWLYPLGVEPAPGVHLNGDATTVAPHLLSVVVHPLTVALGALLSAWWWRRGGAGRDRDDALGLLALVFLLRCALDPWNIHYVQLPLILALAAWEVQRGRIPVATVLSTVAVWCSFVTYTEHYGTGPFLLYAAWTVPLAAYLGHELLAARRPAAADGRESRWATASAT